MSQRTLVTSALPYGNGPIHLGHLVEYIQTDMYVRFLRQLGREVIFVCGDDAHGTAIEIAARRAGILPKDFVEETKADHVKVLADFGLSFDCYHTTHSKENEDLVVQIYEQLKAAGDIASSRIHRFYCAQCSMFLPDRYLLGTCPHCHAHNQYGDLCESCGHVYEPSQLLSPRCANCSLTPEMKTTENLFFQVGNYEAFLDSWIQGAKWLQPQIRKYLLNWLADGLASWDISRDGPYFGFSIPEKPNKFFYVWFDAPIGYIASTSKWCKENEMSLDDIWRDNETEIVHFIGKDIAYFHFLFWPILLYRAGYNLPSRVHVHGHLKVQGRKMSKSRGTFITARQYLQSFQGEHLRFFVAKLLANDIRDIDFDDEKLLSVVNRELVAKIGNFAHRVFQLVLNSFNGQIETVQMNHSHIVHEVLDELDEIKSAYESIDGRRAVRHILAMAKIGNRFIQEKTPWHWAWARPDETKEVLAICLNIVKNLAITLYPIMPELAHKLARRMNLDATRWDGSGFQHSSFTVIEGEKPINPITSYQLARFRQEEQEEQEELVEHEVFTIELRGGKVLRVDDHPYGDRLFVLQVQFDNCQKQIVAGLRGRIGREGLLGKTLVFVTNLLPIEIRGVHSEGMILVATLNDEVCLLSVEAPPGELVAPKDVIVSSNEITLETFHKHAFNVRSEKVYCNGRLLIANGKALSANIGDGATIG